MHLSLPVLLVAAVLLIAGGTAPAQAAFVQQATLTAADGAASDAFGARVAVSASGNTMVVPSEPRILGSPNPGAVYVFEKPASGWADAKKVATLRLPPGGEGPTSVAISGDTIVVGAVEAIIGTTLDQGAVFVFVKPDGGWQDAQPTAILTASDGQGADMLGFSVAISGDSIVSSALQHKVGNNPKQGAAYVFVKPASGWASGHETAELTASDGAANDLLRPVAIDGDTIVAGAQNHKVDEVTNQGEVYVFVKPRGGWATSTETARLTTGSGARDDFMGASVGVSGDTVVAGMPDRSPTGRPPHAGAAEVFVKPASGWKTATETAELTASDGVINDVLGGAVAISGDTIIATADGHTVGQTPGKGQAYVFKRRPGAGWTSATEDQRFTESEEGTNSELFGSSISLSGNVALVGAPLRGVGDKSRAGAAFVFGVPPSVDLRAPVDGASFRQGQTVAASYSCSAPAGAAIASCAGPVAPGAALDTSIPGPHTFTVNAVDSDGITATRSASYTVVKRVPPSIAGLKQSTGRWREHGRRPHGTTFSFRLDQPARVALRFARGGKSAGSLGMSGHSGLNRVRFVGRLSRKRILAPGRYSVRATATSDGGQSSTRRALRFTIVRP